MTVGERIKELRERNGYKASELSELVGVSKQSLYKYENNIVTNIPYNTIERIAAVCNVTPEYVMGWHKEKSVRIPVVGRVAAGLPLLAEENILDYEEIPERIASLGQHFGLRIKGDSMTPRICDGDVVIVRQQPDADSGDCVVAMVNGYDAVCKKLAKYESKSIALISMNPAYEPMVFTQKDIKSLPVTILGKVVELRGKF